MILMSEKIVNKFMIESISNFSSESRKTYDINHNIQAITNEN
jgi:hypothetical protein